jgi:hypothetical protein
MKLLILTAVVVDLVVAIRLDPDWTVVPGPPVLTIALVTLVVVDRHALASPVAVWLASLCKKHTTRFVTKAKTRNQTLVFETNELGPTNKEKSFSRETSSKFEIRLAVHDKALPYSTENALVARVQVQKGNRTRKQSRTSTNQPARTTSFLLIVRW